MKIAFLGDLHFAEYKDFSKNVLVEWDPVTLKYIPSETGKKMNSRLIDISNALVDAREYCITNNIKTVVIAGDISHNRSAVPTVVQNVEYKTLKSFKLKGIELILCSGNHDQVSNEDYPENSLTPFKGFATVISKAKSITRGAAQILCIPFSANKDIVIDAINSFEPLEGYESNIIVAHLGVSGGVTGKNSYVLTDQYDTSELRYQDEKIDLIALGHYHKPQVIPSTDDKVFYTGSPVQMSFSEEGENHGFWIFDTVSKNLVFNSLYAPKFITLTKDTCNNYSTEDLEGNFVRIIGNIDEIANINSSIIQEKQTEEPGTVRIEVEKEYEANHRSDISAAMSYLEAVTTYAKEKDFTEDQLKVGLDILNIASEGEVE